MLKKLVKYGNSNALVLDKAILELLNMGEGSVVKISTDGKSLIITPQESQSGQVVHEPVTSSDALVKASMQQSMKYADPKLDEAKRHELEQRILAARKRFGELTDGLELNEAFQKEMTPWRTKYSSDHKKLLQKFEQVVKKHCPEFLQAREEFEELSKELQGRDFPGMKNYDQMKQGFTDIFMDVKTREIMAKFALVSATEEYQHRAQLITEKYTGNHNSEEFMQEIKKLMYEFCPEMEQLHKQIENNAKKLTA